MAKVLLVEDDNNLKEIFQMRLQAEGFTTLTASDGEEGLVVAMREKPDLIIADVMMPKLSGFEMIESLRTTPEMKDVKVIMMTALGQAEDQARGEKLGVVKYLVKSQVTLEDFARVVTEVLGKPQAAAAGQPAASPTNNNQGGNTMDPQSTNPTPAPSDTPADSQAPAANPMGDSGAQSSAQEQGVVNNQINDFVGSTPDASGAQPGGDSSTPAGGAPSTDSMGTSAPAADSTSTDAPAVPPATEQPANPAQPAEGGQAGSTPPVDPTSNAL